MRKRLFLTGASGIGKSTEILDALGDDLPRAGGFLTVRERNPEGKVQRFFLASTDGRERRVFLDFAGCGDVADFSVFQELAVELLQKAPGHPFAVLDEIGGMELLVPKFSEALNEFLESGTPCIGVMKGFGPASKLIERMGLGEQYCKAHRELYERLENDPDTLLLNLSDREEDAHRKILQWVEEYVHE